MRILYLADIRFPMERANGIQTMQTCYALAERGHRVRLGVRSDVMSPPRDPFAFYGLAATPALELCRLRVVGPPAVRRALFLVASLGRAAGARRHDVLITRDLGIASALLAMPRSIRPPLVVESHGFSPVFAAGAPALLSGAKPRSARKQERLLATERRVWRLADGYVTTTRALAGELAGRFGPRPRAATIPNGVRLGATEADGTAGPREHAVVAYAGQLYPWKGPDVFLRALAALPEVRGVVIGGHPAESDLGRIQALARSLGIDGRVEFTGLVDPASVPARLRDADVLVMPTSGTDWARYSSPLKLFEYMAAARPIVASDLPGTREVLTDGENARLVPPDDPGALADAVRRLIEDPARAGRLGRSAREAAASYSWDRRAERLERLLLEVVGDS